MTRRIPATLASLALAVLLSMIVAPAAFAAEPGEVGGKPANPRPDNPRSQSIFVYEAKPGEKIDDAVQVINNSDQRKTVDVYAVDSVVSSGGAFACAQKADVPSATGKWITVTGSPVVVEAKSKAVVPFTLTVPGNADVGENNACIAIQPQEDNAKKQGNGIVLSFRSAIRVAVTIPGDIKKSLSVASTNVVEKKVQLVATPILKNTGNVSLDAKVDVTLKSLFGTVASDGGTFPVLRGQETELNFDFKQPFWGGWYNAETVAKYVSDPKLTLGAKADPDKSVSATSATVFIRPKPQALAIMAGIVVVILVLIVVVITAKAKQRRLRRRSAKFTIEEGDDLQSLGKEFGVSWKTIAKLNGLKPPYTIHAGQELRIPVKDEPTKKKSKD